MTLILRIKDAKFPTTLPSLDPFVSMSSMAFAFDFRARSNRLEDLTGNTAPLAPYRHDLAAAVKRSPDSTVVKNHAGGLGIAIEQGYLSTSMPTFSVPIDGSKKFSILVVGGVAGYLPESKYHGGVASTYTCLADFGCNFRNEGFNFCCLNNAGKAVGNYIAAWALNNYTYCAANSSTTFQLLTYDGASWKNHNMTAAKVLTKTNSELGLTNALTVDKTHVQTISMGMMFDSTKYADYPALYQFGMWNRVLTDAEIDEQYAKSKAVFGSVGI